MNTSASNSPRADAAAGVQLTGASGRLRALVVNALHEKATANFAAAQDATLAGALRLAEELEDDANLCTAIADELEAP